MVDWAAPQMAPLLLLQVLQVPLLLLCGPANLHPALLLFLLGLLHQLGVLPGRPWVTAGVQCCLR